LFLKFKFARESVEEGAEVVGVDGKRARGDAEENEGEDQ
jgi:hypothetical protein